MNGEKWYIDNSRDYMYMCVSYIKYVYSANESPMSDDYFLEKAHGICVGVTNIGSHHVNLL